MQSIGGGGGAFSASVQEMQIGSTNSSGELSGGDIELITSGSVLTQGTGSVGVSVMSLGGGGGSLFGEANDTIWMGTLDENKSGKIVTSNAGDIDVNQTGEFITTTGEQAGAIVVMSAGGGGGYIAEVNGDLTVGANVIGSTRGGNIDIINTSTINTLNSSSPGIVAQSIGGGGAYIGLVTEGKNVVNFGSEGRSNTSSGNIQIENKSEILTSGVGSPGLLAQSIGGGGGYLTLSASPHFVFNGSTGRGLSISGDIDLKNSQTIKTIETGSQAIVAQSIGGGGGFIGDAGTTGSSVSKVIMGSSGSNDGDILLRVKNQENIWNEFLADKPDWRSIDFISSAWKALAGKNNKLPNVGGISQAGNVAIDSKGDALQLVAIIRL